MIHLTGKERDWVLYDVGNSAFVMLTATVIPIYFKNMAAEAGVTAADSTAYFSYASSLVTILSAVLIPFLGAVADIRGFKKPVFACFAGIGVLGCLLLPFPVGWMSFLGVYVIAKTGYQGSLAFYDSMLADVTSEERMDELSAHGYAWGYIGSCIPFVLSILLILNSDRLGLGSSYVFLTVFFLNAGWWLVMTLPLLKSFEQICYVERREHMFRHSLQRLLGVMKEVWRDRKLFWFLASFFFYIDGVYTIIDMATAYGKDVGISDTDLMLALLLMQVTAFPCSILFGALAKKYDARKLIKVSIIGYLGIVLFALQMRHGWEFWFLAVCVSVFQGGIQALSRSYYTKIIPKEQAAEYFGFYDIFGKGAAFMGTLLLGAATQLSGTSRMGIGLLSLLFAAGYVLFRKAERAAEL
jgi:Permeases of the major facilitator superfamily